MSFGSLIADCQGLEPLFPFLLLLFYAILLSASRTSSPRLLHSFVLSELGIHLHYKSASSKSNSEQIIREGCCTLCSKTNPLYNLWTFGLVQPLPCSRDVPKDTTREGILTTACKRARFKVTVLGKGMELNQPAT